jgi:pantoate--beta-alanine ligase
MSGGLPLPVARTVAELRAATRPWRKAGESVGLVPTMGALHAGHLALVGRATAECDRAVATIFVNPKQFDRKEDLKAYPRGEGRDAGLLAEHACDLLFAPDAEEMYPEGFSSSVAVTGVSEVLDGVYRPGHFTGVTTVVCKLLLQALPDRAYFGEKDFQQLTVVKRMVRDLDIPVEIVPVPTVREADGLALSSRNVHLTPEQRAVAPLLHRVMQEIAAELADGQTPAGLLIPEGQMRLGGAGFTKIDYLALHAADDLAPLARVDRPARLFAAAWLGTTRLIDNVPVEPKV